MIAVVLVVLLAGCGYKPQTGWGKDLVAWWGADGTQAAIGYAKQAASQFAVNAALAALQQWAGGGSMDYGKIAMQGGINTLWQQASNIRQLQGTNQVLDPAATARLLEVGGTPEYISRRLADQLFENATELIRRGVDPNTAAEVNAAGIDSAAFYLTERAEK